MFTNLMCLTIGIIGVALMSLGVALILPNVIAEMCEAFLTHKKHEHQEYEV